MVYAKFFNNKNIKISSTQRICGRCGQRYTVDEQGFAVQQQKCIYHWGKKSRGTYNCCNRPQYTMGCSEAKGHVWEHIDYENLYGYVETLPKGESSQMFSDFCIPSAFKYMYIGEFFFQ